MELKIIEAEQQPDTGPRVGEIAMRGRIVMKGYYKRPEATAEVLKDGWLHTGDLGYIDHHGNLLITGRQKEIIVLSSGKNVYPEEIEAHYLQSPLLKEICVLGVQARPGEPASERLHGVIVPNFEELKARRIVNTREALRYAIENLSVQVPSTKRILSYEFWQDGLPRTTTRKIKRFEVEKRVRERMAKGESAEETTGRELSDVDREWLADAEVQRALAVVRRAARNEKADIHPHDNLELDLGLDSMERVELLVALEHELGGSVEESVISNVYTVRELVDAVRQSTGQAGRNAAPAWEQMLQQEPTDPEVLRVTHPTPLTTATLFLATRIAHMMGRDFFHLKVEGVEKLPKDGPFILAPNHQSFLDAPFLVGALPWHICRKIFYVGTSEIFGTGVWRKIARLLKLIPMDPDANLVSAMQASAYGLRNDMVLVLFPEGERSIDGAPRVFKKGAAILATHLNVPIYPVALDGFYEAWPRGQKFHKFTRARIAIGDPVLPLTNADGLENAYDDLTRKLRTQVLEMWDRLHEELYQHEEAVR
jgi:long-chain acyl-CoA synthetase